MAVWLSEIDSPNIQIHQLTDIRIVAIKVMRDIKTINTKTRIRFRKSSNIIQKNPIGYWLMDSCMA